MKKVVLVQFEAWLKIGEDSLHNKDYAYFTNIEDLNVLDKVVVCVQGELKITTVSKVFGIEEYKGRKAHSWIVDRVDVDAFQKEQEKQEKVQEIRNRINARKKQVEEMTVLKLLAQEDDEMKGLLTELNELDASAVPNSLLEDSSKN
jgi:hypothetical protein